MAFANLLQVTCKLLYSPQVKLVIRKRCSSKRKKVMTNKSETEGALEISTTLYPTPIIHYRPDKLFTGILQTGKKTWTR